MPQAPTTALALVNAALSATGNTLIQTFDDGTTEAIVASENYERLVRAELVYPWTWNVATRRLQQIATPPDAPWEYAYQIPSDVMDVQRVLQADVSATWERWADKILTDADNTDDYLIAVCRTRPDERLWPADFAHGIVLRLESLFLRALSEDYGKADKMDAEAEKVLKLARNADAKRRTPRSPLIRTLRDARTA
jgi:hypothetical protein